MSFYYKPKKPKLIVLVVTLCVYLKAIMINRSGIAKRVNGCIIHNKINSLYILYQYF
jgi:hypothetical protein